MELLEAIRSRRSIGKVKPDPVGKELIDQIIEAGIWAPNHHLTEPWRFIVMTGEGRRRLGNAYAEIAAENIDLALSGLELSQQYDKHVAKAYRAPVVITVAVSPSNDSKVPFIEEIASVHAAIQNMLLTAHSLGLGAIWRTGAPTYHPIMHSAFDLRATEQVAGFIYIGYPDMTTPVVNRTNFKEKTVWLT
jgi:nitroreductase